MTSPLLHPIKAKRGYQSTWLKPHVFAAVTAITEHVNGYWKLSVNGEHLGSVECPYCVGDEIPTDGGPATIRKVEAAKIGDCWYWALTCKLNPPTFLGRPVCKNCYKPKMNCDCYGPFEAAQ